MEQPQPRRDYTAYIVESAWILPSIAIPIAMFVALVLTIYLGGIHLPGHADHLAPEAVAATPPFNQPGVRQIGPREYEVVMVAQVWSWNPREIRVPAGSKVNFVLASRDVTHGLLIDGTTVNVMVLPGEISRVSHVFDRPGEYLMVCQEYCGTGHHLMSGRVVVEGGRGWQRLAQPRWRRRTRRATISRCAGSPAAT